MKGSDSLQNRSVPTQTSGLFVWNESIPCSGLLRTVTVKVRRAYCRDSQSNGSIVQYSMQLLIARENRNTNVLETTHTTTVTGDCENRRFEICLDLEVMAGDFIAVEVAKECTSTTEGNVIVCPFLPVVNITTDTTTRILHNTDIDFNNTRGVPGLVLAIMADIDRCKNCTNTL